MFSSVEFVLLLAAFLVVAVMLSLITSRIRKQSKESKQREAQINQLYQLSRDLAGADALDEVLEVTRKNISKILDAQVAIFLKSQKRLDVVAIDEGFPLSAFENATALQAFEKNQPAGFGTDLYQEARAVYLPLKASLDVFGVLGVYFKELPLSQKDQGQDILNALVYQAAIAIHRTKLAEVSRQIELMKETEKLQTALLNSISHDLKTPLVSILGVLDNLLHDYSSLDQQTRVELLATAYEDADHLNRLVSNLLDMTRLEAKALKLRVEPCELRDVIGASLQRLKEGVKDREVVIDIPEDFTEVPMDFELMMRVFINLVDNAVKYSPSQSKIRISCVAYEDNVRIEIRDEGIGIPKDDLSRVFDKFYRAVKPKQITGTGLGLSICKGIVEVHGGSIHARNNPDKGVTMVVDLPCSVNQEGGLVHGR